MAEVNSEDLKKLEKGLRGCIGDECNKLQTQYDDLKNRFDALKVQEPSGTAPPQWGEDQAKKHIEECVGAACKNIVEKDLPTALDVWHKDAQEKQAQAIKEAEEQERLRIEAEGKTEQYCWECSANLPPSQFAKLGEGGCTHSE